MSHSRRIRLTEVRAVFRLLGDLRDLHSDTSAWQLRLIEGLLQLLGGHQGSCFRFGDFAPDRQVKLVSSVHAGWGCPETALLWDRVMKSKSWRGDPILNEAVKVPGNVRTRSREMLIDDKRWYSSQVWEEVVKPSATDDVMVCWQRTAEHQHVIGLSLQRHQSDGPFSLRHRNVLHLLNLELYRLQLQRTLDHPSEISERRLTPRQKHTAQLLAQGKSLKEVAAAMQISFRTVEDYVKVIYRVYGVTTRAELLVRLLGRP